MATRKASAHRAAWWPIVTLETTSIVTREGTQNNQPTNWTKRATENAGVENAVRA